jgi:hypothetical protein
MPESPMELAPKSGCLVCGAVLTYFEAPRDLACAVCGAVFPADASCDAGHFVCDACHSSSANDWIERRCATADGADPMRIAIELMRSPHVTMHGPEHHFLVPASLLAAWHNAGGPAALGSSAEKSDQIRKARRRAELVPGGFCGTHGACGAAIGCGIFVSVITRATPLSGQEWRLSNEATAEALQAIAALGGPRCCKRDSFLAIIAARDFVGDRFGVALPIAEPLLCEFIRLNKECTGQACPFCP